MKLTKLTSVLLLSSTILLTGCFERVTSSNNVSGNDVSITTLSPGGKAFASLSWTANAGEQDGFYVEGSSDNASFVTVAIVPDGTTTATIASLANNTTYFFRIRGYNASGTSSASTVVQATTPP
jgi:hypothetical protein